MNKVIIREVRKSYQPIVDYLLIHKGFEIVNLLEKDETPIQSKKAWLKQGLAAAWSMLLHLGFIRQAHDSAVLIGNYSAVFALLLNRLHLIHPKRLYWWGFFLHGAKAQRIMARAIRFLYSPNVRFIVFSTYELELYRNLFSLDSDSFIHIPYGDWAGLGSESESSTIGDYYFAGGYTNRDYRGLIQAWKDIDQKLVIIGSANNTDLTEYVKNPSNDRITVLLDTDGETFDKYLRGAKACIQPFTSNTGASGQTVALRAMRLGKVMISTDISAMREYIEDGGTGILFKNMAELPGIINNLDNDTIEIMRVSQEYLYQDKFSKEAVFRALDQAI